MAEYDVGFDAKVYGMVRLKGLPDWRDMPAKKWNRIAARALERELQDRLEARGTTAFGMGLDSVRLDPRATHEVKR